jgi:phospholipid/cholesterol/gamma-HCH transport system permease protein
MESLTPRIEQQAGPQGLVLHVLGAWTAADLNGKAAWQALTAQFNASVDASAKAHWDLQHIHKLDHLGAQLLWAHWGRAWPASVDVPDSQRALFDTVARFAVTPPPAPKFSWLSPLTNLGARLLALVDHCKALTRLIGQLLLTLFDLSGTRKTGRGATCLATCTTLVPRRCPSPRWWVF